MRAKSQNVIDRQAQRDAERRAAIDARLAKLVAAAPNADVADLKHIAIWNGTEPSFSTILRVLEAR